MNVPSPPPHTVAPPAPVEPPAPEPVAELPPAVPPATPRRSAARDTPRETPKPEPKPEPSESAPLPQTPPSQPAAPVPPLRTSSTADDQAAARSTRALVDRARGMLNAIDYRQLTTERKAQYDTAKRFLEQADDAIKSGNYVFAQSLGEKAETIARELSGK
jgi:outer membrane biosynthesis protein TonB